MELKDQKQGTGSPDLQHQDYMTRICNAHELYDVFAKLHPTEIETPSYKWGTKRLDYILLSTRAPIPHKMGYQPFDLFHSSNHRSLYMYIALNYSKIDKIQKMEH